MSNAADFGSRLILPGHGIFLHNRGVTSDGMLTGAADPRAGDGAFVGR